MEETARPQSEKPLGGSPFARSVLDWTETIVMAVVLVAVVFTFLARVITVDGRSMEPTYHNGDRVLVTNLAGAPQQGDVVIVINALEEPIIKRVVATEGQTVDFDPVLGEVLVDGAALPGRRTPDPALEGDDAPPRPAPPLSAARRLELPPQTAPGPAPLGL